MCDGNDATVAVWATPGLEQLAAAPITTLVLKFKVFFTPAQMIFVYCTHYSSRFKFKSIFTALAWDDVS